MNCPVCNSTELSEDTSACPQCHSDLEVFRLIVDASEQRQKNKKIISALSLFAGVTAIGWASVGMFSGNSGSTPIELSPEATTQNEVRTTEDSSLINMLTSENEALKTTIASYSEKAHTVKEKPAVKEKSTVKTSAPVASTGTVIHTVRNGDTFWIIAKKYFHDGTKYKKIAKDNGMTVKTKLHKGQKIKIVNG